MAKTIQVAADRAYDPTKTVLPVEVARGIYIENPPSAQALKLMHLLIAKAGGRMAEEVQHEMRMADLKHIEGMRNHDRASLRTLFTQLRAAVMVYDDTEAQEEIIGGFMDEIRLDYRQEVVDTLVVKWWFGRTFRRIAAESNHWAILDRQTVFALSSKYSILLFQHIASLANLDRIDRKSFTVPELRALFGVEGGKLDRFADLNRRALQPAIAEINQLSRLKLKATPRKTGRTVTSVEISWKLKADPTDAKQELARPKVGRKARQEGTVETLPAVFPETGGIGYSPRWLDLKQQAGCNMDNILIATNFRRFLDERGVARDVANIESLFLSYCRKIGRV
ncbi:replication initiation protein [Ponticaulis profundi]|uniref:Replication initiation protein n=1 Tax=Ponticaulis profundi TaxID=2665222 RepID=A0ABW1S7Y0_9PROT